MRPTRCRLTWLEPFLLPTEPHLFLVPDDTDVPSVLP
jgi:hypothetical protein